MEMTQYKLGDLCRDVVDCPHTTPEWKSEGVHVIRNFNIKNGTLDFTDGFYVDEETYQKRTQRAVPEESDLVISRDAPMGAACIIPKLLKCCLGQRLVLLKINRNMAEPKYVLYAIQSDFVQQQIRRIDQTGSIVSNLNIPDLKSLLVPVPSLPEQKKIAAALSALDDKIALNKKMNQKLEAMAKRLYDYWFVQFDFPDENGRPYKTSGGPMTYNPTLNREIPKGWEVKYVNDVTSSVRGVAYSSDDEKRSTDTDVIQILRGNNISGSRFIFDSNEVFISADLVQNDQKISKYDIVMTMSSGSKEHVGKSALALFDMPHSFGAFCSKFTPNKNARYFIDCYLHSEFFIKYIRQTCSGTGINNLTNGHFDKAAFAWPSKKILDRFNEKLYALYERRGVIEREISRLTTLRDKLLPLLMNGQVTVG